MGFSIRMPSPFSKGATSDVTSEMGNVQRMISSGGGMIRPRPTSSGDFAGARLAGQRLGLGKISGSGYGQF